MNTSKTVFLWETTCLRYLTDSGHIYECGADVALSQSAKLVGANNDGDMSLRTKISKRSVRVANKGHSQESTNRCGDISYEYLRPVKAGIF